MIVGLILKHRACNWKERQRGGSHNMGHESSPHTIQVSVCMMRNTYRGGLKTKQKINKNVQHKGGDEDRS